MTHGRAATMGRHPVTKAVKWTDPLPDQKSWIKRVAAVLVAAWATGDWQAVPTALMAIGVPLGEVAATVAQREAVKIGVRLGAEATDAYAVRWAEANAARLVTEITKDTEAVIRGLTTWATREGVSGETLARMLRQHIGLTERLSTAVRNYEAGLLADGATPIQALAAADQYAARLRTYRAEMIARTETLAAANAGRLDSYRLAQANGVLGPDATKVWLASPGCCALCDDVNGETAPLDEDFSCGETAPPLHPQCRCAVAVDDVGTNESTDGAEITVQDVEELAWAA